MNNICIMSVCQCHTVHSCISVCLFILDTVYFCFACDEIGQDFDVLLVALVAKEFKYGGLVPHISLNAWENLSYYYFLQKGKM